MREESSFGREKPPSPDSCYTAEIVKWANSARGGLEPLLVDRNLESSFFSTKKLTISIIVEAIHQSLSTITLKQIKKYRNIMPYVFVLR